MKKNLFTKLTAVILTVILLSAGSLAMAGARAETVTELPTVHVTDPIKEALHSFNLPGRLGDCVTPPKDETADPAGQFLQDTGEKIVRSAAGKFVGTMIPYVGLTAVPERLYDMYTTLKHVNLNDPDAGKIIGGVILDSMELGFDTVCDLAPGAGGLLKNGKDYIKEGVNLLIDWFS